MVRDNFREFCTGDPMLLLMENDKGFASIDDKLIMQSGMIPPPMMTSAGLGGPMMLDGDGEPGHEAVFSDEDDDDGENGAGGGGVTTTMRNSTSGGKSTLGTGGGGGGGGKDDLTDDDDDLPLSKVRLKEKPTGGTGAAPVKVELPTSINASFDKFVNSKTTSDFDSFFTDFRTVATTALNQEQEQYIHTVVVEVVRTGMAKYVFPAEVTGGGGGGAEEKSLQESLNVPLFTLYKLLAQQEDKCKKCVQNLAAELYRKCPAAGYFLLYFLKAQTKLSSSSSSSKKGATFKASTYRSLCTWAQPDEKLDQCLARDLKEMERDHAAAFLWLLPDIYREYSGQLVNHEEVLRLTLGAVDARNLRDLIYAVTQGKLQMLKGDGLVECVRHSLAYETFEQFCLWQLIQAHDIPLDTLQDILPELEAANHAEALTYMLLLLKNEEPTAELIRLLLSRETRSRGDPFVTSALR